MAIVGDMRRYSPSPACFLVCLLCCIAHRGALAAEGLAVDTDARQLLELGQLQFSKQEYEQAAQNFQRSLQVIESRSGPLNLALLEPLSGLAKAYSATRQFESTVSTSQRALAIVRRTAGVNDSRQLPVLEELIEAQGNLGLIDEAIPNLRYRERVSEAVHGEASLEHARELTRIGDWYCRLGDFFAARQRHRSAIEIIESISDFASPALIEPLRAVARCCLTELATEGVESSSGVAQGFRGPVFRTGRLDPTSVTFGKHVQELLRFDGEQAIARAAAIADVPDNTTPEVRLEVYLQAGDWFQLRDQPRTAAEYYKRAYDVSLTLPQDVFEQQQWLEPKSILYPLPPIALRNLLQGEVPGARFVDLAFSVRADGRVRSPEVVLREDVGKTMVDETIASLLVSRYRPRLVDGKPTAADDVRFRQRF
jgi:tetratricopeptide (TPR) repeat protein